MTVGSKIKEDASWDEFAGTSLRERRFRTSRRRVVVIAVADGWLLPVRLDAVFKTEKFPTGVTQLATCLT